MILGAEAAGELRLFLATDGDAGEVDAEHRPGDLAPGGIP
jgi:hypothetical protein